MKKQMELMVGILALAMGVGTSVVCKGAADVVSPKVSEGQDWPQWRGPNRDGIAVNSPKLLDSWPKEGPPLLWKSDWIPACEEGGCGSPIVADGKVFLYVNWKHPVGGGNTYKIMTPEMLAEKADLPGDMLAKLKKMNETGYPRCRLWQTELNKIGFSMNANWAFFRKAWSRSFTMSDTMVCLDAATGKTLWKKDFPQDMAALNKYRKTQWWCFGGDANISVWGIGGSATPAFWGGKVYAVGAAGLYCLSAKDGALLWKVEGEPAHASPLVAEGIVYNGANGRAYDAETGKELWVNPLWSDKWRQDDTGKYSSPLLWTSEGKTYVISTDGGRGAYCCLELKTGKVLWSVKGGVVVLPNASGDILMVPNFGNVSAYQMTPTGAVQLWTKQFEDGPGDIFHQGHLYVNRHVYACVDLKTGEYHWRKTGLKDLYDFIYSSLVLADGKLFTAWGQCHQLTKGYGDLTYSMAMIRATPEKYVQLSSFDPKLCMMTSPAMAGGRLYLRLLDGVACYDIQEHGIYLGGMTVTKDALVFRFEQTGGGLVASDLKDIRIAEAGGAAKPVAARISGDEITVDIKEAAMPFAISYAGGGAIKGKNGHSVPAFGWDQSRVLEYRKCFENTICLKSSQWLQQDGRWNKAETYEVTGAKVTKVELDPEGKGVNLITDKSWIPGDTVTLTYPGFPVDQGTVRREKLTATVVATQRAAAKFLKADDTTAGNWKGVYGAEGAVICADKDGMAPQCAMVTVMNSEDGTPWAAKPTDPRYLQKSGETQNRTVTAWHAGEQFEIAVEITDGKEHQVAVYSWPWGRGMMTVEMLDGDTKAVLDTRELKSFSQGMYLVWNIKGRIVVRLTSTNRMEGSAAAAQGVFLDPVGK